MAEVILVCGPAGAGKTTHSRALESHGYVRLAFDDLAWERGYREHPVADDAANEIHGRLRAMLAEHVEEGNPVVVDTSFWSRASRDAYRSFLAPLGIVPVVHYLDTPRELILERLARRANESPADIDVPIELAIAYIDGFQIPTADEGPIVVIST